MCSILQLFQPIKKQLYTDRNSLADLQKKVTHLLVFLFESSPILPVTLFGAKGQRAKNKFKLEILK
jgi:hypothetical protein